MSWSRIASVVTALTVLLATPAAAQEGPANRALLDVAGTGEMLDHAKDVSEQLFTYSYTDLKGHEAKFKDLTTGEFSHKYGELFASITAQASGMRLMIKSTVKDAAVRVLTADHAEVLVFIDQSSTRGDTGATSTAGSMFLATFTKVGGTWKVSDIDLFQDGE